MELTRPRNITADVTSQHRLNTRYGHGGNALDVNYVTYVIM